MNAPFKQSVCLNMIVKNEAHVIARCIASVRPLITCWRIVDTGSTDGTPELVRELLKDLPGEVVSRPWVDFATNRTEALELARDAAEYTLVMDADDTLELDANALPAALEHDAYYVRVSYGKMGFNRIHLMRNTRAWRYVGVLHEVVDTPADARVGLLSGALYRVIGGGGRSRNPKKYEDDAAVLVAALEREPENARYVFYLAQSYRDSGRLSEARVTYARRAAMGGWAEEVWYSLYQAAILSVAVGRPKAEVGAAFERAHAFRPSRAEALCVLARYAREQGDLALAWRAATAATAIPRPPDHLFVDETAYAWGCWEQRALVAAAMGRRGEASAIYGWLLTKDRLPPDVRRRLLRQAAACEHGGDPASRCAPVTELPFVRRGRVCRPAPEPGEWLPAWRCGSQRTAA